MLLAVTALWLHRWHTAIAGPHFVHGATILAHLSLCEILCWYSGNVAKQSLSSAPLELHAIFGPSRHVCPLSLHPSLGDLASNDGKWGKSRAPSLCPVRPKKSKQVWL